MTSHVNPWAARFEPLLDKVILKQRATVALPALEGLSSMPTELACKSLETALKSVFYPTTQCVDILHRLVSTAYAHCMTFYPDPKAFLAGVYAKHPPFPEFFNPICLTGLAGIGKTELMKAFCRIQVEKHKIVIDDEHSPFSLRSSWFVTIKARSSPKDVLLTLVQSDGAPSDLVDLCRKIAFRDGIPVLAADEFQFATGSANANTLVTRMLLSLGYIGIPFLFIANYSLVLRLQKRPEEDQQRLLSDCLVLLPEHPLSEDWKKPLESLQMVAPDILTFDIAKDAADLHSYSAGLKRALVRLIVLAFRAEHPHGGKVDLSAIKRAYLSIGYANYREEVEILATQAIQNRPHKTRKDLWCPIPLPTDATAAFTESVKEKRNERVADEELKSALTGEERQALQELQKGRKNPKKASGIVVPIRKKAAPTADDFKSNANWFKDQI